ncbi:hypothetical protein PO124_18390 [Bacillus licheniformis]|nr:hypothetical protein [Bacillus licheniformis]
MTKNLRMNGRAIQQSMSATACKRHHRLSEVGKDSGMIEKRFRFTRITLNMSDS